MAEVRNDAFAAVQEAQAAAKAEAPPFIPGPPVPLRELGGASVMPHWQDRIIERDRAGESVDVIRPQSFRDFVCATLASDGEGVPVLSGSKWMGLDETLVRGTGAGNHDPVNGRHRWSRLPQILERVAREIEATRFGRRRVVNGIDGVMQVRIALLYVGGEPVRRDIHAGTRLDDEDRAAMRRAKRAGRKAMKPPRRKPEWRTDFVPMKAGKIAELVATWGGVISARGVIACVEDVEELAFKHAPAGWLHAPRPRVKVAAKPREGEPMANAPGYDLNEWKPILDIIGCSANYARKLMKREVRPLPVISYLGTPQAKRAELIAWRDAEIAAAIAENERRSA